MSALLVMPLLLIYAVLLWYVPDIRDSLKRIADALERRK